MDDFLKQQLCCYILFYKVKILDHSFVSSNQAGKKPDQCIPTRMSEPCDIVVSNVRPGEWNNRCDIGKNEAQTEMCSHCCNDLQCQYACMLSVKKSTTGTEWKLKVRVADALKLCGV